MLRLLLAVALLVMSGAPALAQNQGAAANHLGTSRGSVPQLKTAVAAEAAADEDLVIAAVTGKRIAVVGFTIVGTTADAGVFQFNCGVGGTTMWSTHLPATIGYAWRESAETGGFLFRCASGVGVAADNNIAANNSVKINIRYVVED